MSAGACVARRSERERVSDPGDDGPSWSSRVLVGCGLVLVVVVLVAGVVGITVGARQRLAGWGHDDEGSEPEAVDPGEPALPEPIPPPPDAPRPSTVEDMQRRYRPGPHVRVESMVPSGRLVLPTTPGQVVAGRTTDNPWIVPGSELVPAPLPAPAPVGPRVAHDPREPASQPLTVVARTPARVMVSARDADGGTNVTAYLVELVGYRGHFRLPATAPTELGAVSAGGSDGGTIHFAILSPMMPGGAIAPAGQTFPVTMRIAAVDDRGRVSAPITRELSVVAVGAGDVEVTLTMSEPTDLDLYVTDPTTTTIYYANTNAMSGGQLDLDANAACSSNMGVNTEHVFWREGQAPSGTYRVNVAHYESCISGRPVSYRVTVRACGETVVLSGRFAGGANPERCFAASPHDASWCQEVVTFDVPPCS